MQVFNVLCGFYSCSCRVVHNNRAVAFPTNHKPLFINFMTLCDLHIAIALEDPGAMFVLADTLNTSSGEAFKRKIFVTKRVKITTEGDVNNKKRKRGINMR